MLLDNVKERLLFYRDMQLLPTAQELDFGSWIENFETADDKELAAHILKFFIYIPDQIINQLLKTAVGRCGYFFSKYDSTWTHDSFKNNCWYSFIQGEDKNDVTDSGYIFTRKLRDHLNIRTDRILDFKSMIEMLEINNSEPQNVILVDDFVGTGAQTDNAWNVHNVGKTGMTLAQLANRHHHHIIYAPLVVNHIGFERIIHNCSGLGLEYIYLLNEEYNLLNVNCPCWQGDKVKYNRFIDLLREVANKENIPQTDGYHVNDMFGFGRQGLAIAFSHGIPDACPAFFYWDSPTWKPLMKRPYHRP